MITVRTYGFRELQSALQELPKATQRNVLKRAVERAAKPIADLAKSLVPVDSGALKRSIKAVAKQTGGKAGKAAFAAAMRGGASRAEAGAAARAANSAANAGPSVSVLVGPSRLPHAHLVEFGTSRMKAQPFLRPAWDSRRGPALDTIRSELKAEIDKAAKRMRARAAKKARV